MVTGNFKLAYDSIASSKWRSFLTMLGVIIGVASVVTIVSIGQGVKQQISDQISQMGRDIITIRPGKPVAKDDAGNITGVNFMASFSGNSLTEKDVNALRKTKDVTAVVPLNYITSTPEFDGRQFQQGSVFGVSDQLPTVLNQKLAYGEFFKASDDTKNIAVIGQNVAEDLFRESVPMGQSFTLRGQTFQVRGVFEEFMDPRLTPNVDYNNAIFIPFGASKKLADNQTNIQQILIKPVSLDATNQVAIDSKTAVLASHGGQEDFTVLKQEDMLAIANTFLTLITSLIAGIAAISLIVGGIGIMNIMLVTVTERTQEIGIRKAVGATNNQILAQFVIESSLISFIGGILGIVVAVITNFGLRIFTDLQPVVNLPIIYIALLVALVVGVIFGVAPAMKAAHKDPIEALRKG